MGDRCAVHFEVKTSDKEVFLAALSRATGYPKEEPESEYEDADEGTTELEFTDCNYAWTDEIEKLAADPQCPPFIGNHTEGGEYGPELFAKDSQGVVFVNCDWGYYPTVSYTSGGVPIAGHFENVMLYQRLVREFQDYALEAK